MQQITGITSDVKQKMVIPLENQESFEFFLHYNVRMEAWYFDFTYNDITAKNLKVCLHPNILRQFKRRIPFGIAFMSKSMVEPFQLTSFVDGACEMYILEKEEVQEVEDTLFAYQEPKQYKYVGDFTSLNDLQNYTGLVNKGDYAFIVHNNLYSKYSYNGNSWVRA